MKNRILLLLDHRANSQLMSQALQPHYDVVRPTNGRIPDEPFDLAVVDDGAMRRLREELRALRAAQQPFFLPVVYVTSRQGTKLVTQQMWQVVDDLLVTPMERAELLARIQVHMRARNYSLELKQRNEELRRLDTLKDEFLSIISHELRTPINAIMGFGSVLDDGLVGQLNPEQHQYLQKMLVGSEHLLALVDELLVMSRIQAGQLTLDLEPASVSELVARSVEGLSPLAERKRQRLMCQVPESLPAFPVDPRRVSQVLINLIGNAIKFTPEGGEIRLEARLAGNRLVVEVEDTGIGIAEADIEKLFRRFSQVDTSFTREAGGTGLGLAISRGIIEAHGGEIGVTSVPGQGSTFWFALPLPKEQPVEAVAP